MFFAHVCNGTVYRDTKSIKEIVNKAFLLPTAMNVLSRFMYIA